MSQLNTPNIFVQGTTINAAPFNVNFAAIQTAVNSIDNSNIGAAGLFASQLLPTTAGQATFGGMIGYNFLAPTASTTPLTVSGVAGQSVDIFDVTLTSGGTKAIFVSSNGLVTSTFGMVFTNANLITAAQVGIAADGAATAGMFFNVPTGSTNGYIWGINGSTKMQLTNGGGLNVPGGPIFTGAATSTTNTDLSSSRSGTTGVIAWGSTAASNCTSDFGLNSAGTLTFKNGAGSAFIPLSALSFTPTSDQTLKENIIDLSYGLETVNKMRSRSFDWINSKKHDIGFIAQEMETIVPEVVSKDNNGICGLNYNALVPILVKAIQELSTKIDGLGQ